MIYLWLKAFHIAAAILWTGGVLVAALAATAASTTQSTAAIPLPMLRNVQRWDQWVTVPAMLAVWGLGLLIAIQGHWFTSRWLMAKLPCVLALSLLHAICSGLLRRQAGRGDQAASPLLRHTAPIVPLLVLVIAILAVTKPF